MIIITSTIITESDDIELFEIIFKKYKYKVFSIAVKILKSNDLAEDATSEVFLYIAKCFEKIKKLDDHRLDYYVTIVSRNIAIDINRREKKYLHMQELSDDFFSDDSLRAYDAVLLKNVISTLSYEDQKILYMRYTLDLEHKHIAKSLGISKVAARKRLQIAKAHLKNKLDGGVSNK